MSPVIEVPRPRPRRRPRRSLFPYVTAAALLVTGSALWLHGAPYYVLPQAQRPESLLHQHLGPARFVGHGLGVAGGAMMLLMLLYAVRKRTTRLRRWGPLRYWLNAHIFLGLMGPLLVTFHTAFRVGGLVSIAYWSMVVSVLSGIFGRYVYVQLPRHAKGELRQEASQLEGQLRELLAEDPVLLRHLLPANAIPPGAETSGGRALLALLRHDVARLVGRRRLSRLLRAQSHLSRPQVRATVRLAERRALLVRRLSVARAMERVFHYWHVFHRPFAWVMFLIVAVHVAVTLFFGYTWV
ncbi:MAG: hypothetical protein AB1505_02565 [Candidatus Latescibacterota bacterium]